MKIKTRFAPSPTGYLHVGGLRTALYNYLYTKKMGGEFILRIEDTDKARQIEGATSNLISIFEKMNISFDEGPHKGGNVGPYLQSHRLNIYNEYINILLENQTAYRCFCSKKRLDKMRSIQIKNKEIIKYDRYCLSLSLEEIEKNTKIKPYVIRMKVPEKKTVEFFDGVREKIIINSNELDDQVLIKSDGYPTYHFANIIDDYLMGVTHVIRGEEWLPSTPKHVLLYNFFDWKQPKFIHLPLLLNSDKSKLSKRQGDVSIESYLQKGYLPEAIINFVALLGWHPKNSKELFTLDELIKNFSIKHIQKSGAVFDLKKLNWMNSQYLKSLPLQHIVSYSKPFFKAANFDISNTKKFHTLISNIRMRVNTINELIDYSIPFYKDLSFCKEDTDILQTKSSQIVLNYFFQNLSKQKSLNSTEIQLLVNRTSEKNNITGKGLYLPLRLALSGYRHGMDIPQLIEILGFEESLSRIKYHLPN